MRGARPFEFSNQTELERMDSIRCLSESNAPRTELAHSQYGNASACLAAARREVSRHGRCSAFVERRIPHRRFIVRDLQPVLETTMPSRQQQSERNCRGGATKASRIFLTSKACPSDRLAERAQIYRYVDHSALRRHL